jgi:asparagine synthase (glutamine-hydrolysing)
VPTGLIELLRADQLSIWITPGTPVLELPGGRGWIIGRLFRKNEEATAVKVMTAGEAETLLASQGISLFDDFWGAYVAVMCPGDGAMPFLLRDASGFMPCYILPDGRGVHFASDIEMLFVHTPWTPSVDWSMLGTHLLVPELRRQATCLFGLSELGQGHALAANGRGAQRCIWSPRDHVQPLEGSAGMMAERLEATILSTTKALAGSYGHVLVGASGGLDSSIVCAALADAGHSFACFTMATQDPSGDERRYVHVLASSLGAQCLEYFYEAGAIDPTRSSSLHLPRPTGRFFVQEIERAYRDAWAATGAEAIFTGNGGDNVFSFLHSASPVVDRLISEGPGLSIWKTMVDMCRITGCNVATMIRGTARGWVRRHRAYSWPIDDRLLAFDAPVEDRVPVLAPWLEEDLLPGKRSHVAALMRIQHAIEGYRRQDSIPVIPSLLAQPVVELCLSIPSWLWCEGGINRAMARRSFGKRLPPAVMQRVSKTGPESFSAELFELSLPVLREQLLGGMLRQAGLIDLQAVEEALARTATRRGQLFHRLLALAEAEAWSRHWHVRQAG